MYQYASNILINVEQMNSFFKKGIEKELLFQLYSANVADIIRRLCEYRDEIGFVYIMKNQKTIFQYTLEKNQLEFKLLEESCAILYLGEQHPQYNETDISQINWQEIELVQNYTEELEEANYWKLKNSAGENLSGLHIKVVTNSDCVVEQLLSTTKLANISSGYLTNNLDERNYHGIPVYGKENKIWFGYIKRKEKEWLHNLKEWITSPLWGCTAFLYCYNK